MGDKLQFLINLRGRLVKTYIKHVTLPKNREDQKPKQPESPTQLQRTKALLSDELKSLVKRRNKLHRRVIIAKFFKDFLSKQLKSLVKLKNKLHRRVRKKNLSRDPKTNNLRVL